MNNFHKHRRWNIGIVNDEYFYFLEFLYSVVNASATNYGDLAKFAQDERFDDIDLFDVAKTIDRTFEQTITSYDPNIHVEVQPIMTERGMCYAFNSPMSEILRQRKMTAPKFRNPLSCQYGKQQCFLKLDIYENTGTLEIHSPFEVAGADADLITLQKSDEILASYKVVETVASASLRDLSPNQRKCVFSDENTAELPFYSKTLCLMKCRAVMALEMCNCVPYFYPFVDGPSCTPAGFECLLDFKWPIWALHICKCPSTCTEQQYSVHAIKKRTWSVNADIPFHPKSSFRWDVLPPKVRIRRSVLFSFEDLLADPGTLGMSKKTAPLRFYSPECKLASQFELIQEYMKFKDKHLQLPTAKVKVVLDALIKTTVIETV
ncbi:unnamed protein product [Hermetia illucens]|uniref:Sodium channel protein Nach n=1 Tax=Hermetia illucens TaxID=343691 RepID=A0A7R8YQI2_HERIL|nr:unnamed protein product [Hermetia illucens]